MSGQPASVGVFKGALAQEGQNLLELFRNTLSFTVSLNAVNTLVAERDESALFFAVGVAALLFIILALQHALAAVHFEVGSPLISIKELCLFLLRQAGVVTVQFESNLFAHVLRTVFMTAISTGWVIAFAVVGLGLFHAGTLALHKQD